MCKKIMLVEENKGIWVYKIKNINNMFGWLVKVEINLGYKKDYIFKMFLNLVG